MLPTINQISYNAIQLLWIRFLYYIVMGLLNNTFNVWRRLHIQIYIVGRGTDYQNYFSVGGSNYVKFWSFGSFLSQITYTHLLFSSYFVYILHKLFLFLSFVSQFNNLITSNLMALFCHTNIKHNRVIYYILYCKLSYFL